MKPKKKNTAAVELGKRSGISMTPEQRQQRARNAGNTRWHPTKNKNTINLSKLTYRQMADIVEAIGVEIKHRNSIGVNMYIGYIRQAWAAIDEIANGESNNFTSECGPRESKRPRKINDRV